MEKQITKQNLSLYAYTNLHLLKEPVRETVVFFPGLGTKEMIREDPEIAQRYAARGILYVVPYYNPWCWMNDGAVLFTDEILQILWKDLPAGLPAVYTGQSMGGLCALIYTARGARTPASLTARSAIWYITQRSGRIFPGPFTAPFGAPRERWMRLLPQILPCTLPGKESFRNRIIIFSIAPRTRRSICKGTATDW